MIAPMVAWSVHPSGPSSLRYFLQIAALAVQAQACPKREAVRFPVGETDPDINGGLGCQGQMQTAEKRIHQ